MKHRKDRQRRNLRWQRDFPLSFRASGRAASAGVVALLAFGVAAQAPARAASPFLDPTTPADATNLGLAGTGRAVASNLDNIWYGSAPLALDSRYDIHGSGYLQPSSWRGFGVAALDSRTSLFSLGLSYSYMQHADMPMLSSELPGWELPGQASENPATTQHVAGGVAMAGDPDRRITLGLHGGYFWRRAARAGEGNGVHLGGSIAGRPHDSLSLLLATTWPIQVENARGYEEQPRVDAGLCWEPAPGLRLLVDGMLPVDELDGVDLGLGAEYLIAELVPVRVGWNRQAGTVRHALGAGVGVAHDYLDLQYGVWFDPDPDALIAPVHGLTLAMKL